MRKWIYLLALVLGAGIGTALVGATNHALGMRMNPDGADHAGKSKSTRIPEVVGVRIERLIAAKSSVMNDQMPLENALNVLFTERKSPMRTRAFLRSRIYMMTTDQLTQALRNGEVQSKAEIDEIARRLAKEDPEVSVNHLDAGELRLSGMDNLYTFLDGFFETWGDADPDAVVTRLKKMERGGSQQDRSLRFSSYLAKTNPAVAARNFNDLIYLRNMQDQGDMIFTDNTYAEEVVRSWKTKDETAMRDYIGNLPTGRDREALDKALRKLDEKK